MEGTTMAPVLDNARQIARLEERAQAGADWQRTHQTECLARYTNLDAQVVRVHGRIDELSSKIGDRIDRLTVKIGAATIAMLFSVVVLLLEALYHTVQHS